MSLDISLTQVMETEVYEANITHNLNKMAKALGIYGMLWRPEENNIEKAFQLITPLRKAIKKMEEYPEVYRPLQSENGWGTYNDFLPWLRKLREACIEFPQSKVVAYR